MPKSSTKMQSWQVFHYARKHLGSSKLYAIFGKKNARAVDYWCEDPDCTARPEGSYDPIKGVKRLLEALDDLGHIDQVRATVAYLISSTSIADDLNPKIQELKPTMAEEILADYASVSALQAAIEDGHNIPSINQKCAAAIAELQRTVAKYTEQQSR